MMEKPKPRYKKLDWPEEKTYRYEATMAGAKYGGTVGAAVFVGIHVVFMLSLQEGSSRPTLFPHLMALFGFIGFIVGSLVGALVGVLIDRMRG